MEDDVSEEDFNFYFQSTKKSIKKHVNIHERIIYQTYRAQYLFFSLERL